MTVTASESYPTRHASLSDGSTTIEFNLYPNERSFRAQPYPRTALKTTQGESKYSDLEPPYFAIAQDNFTGGRGNEDFEADTSRYFDGYRADTSKESGVVVGGLETYTDGYRRDENTFKYGNNSGSSVFYSMFGATRFRSAQLVTTDTNTITQAEILVRLGSATTDLKVAIYSDTAGEPNAELDSVTISAADITTDQVSLYKLFPGFNQATAAATTYHVVVDGGSTATSGNYWSIGSDTATRSSSNWSSDGSAWSTGNASPRFRLTGADADFNALFFGYKSGLYMATQPDSGNSALYLNGYRGAADSNSTATATLVDASQSWTTDELVGTTVLLTNGPGSGEIQNWRSVTTNTGTSLTVSPAWNVEHTTETEYVILGSDKWTALDADLGKYVTDVAVGGDYIYLAHGGNSSSTGIHQYRYYNAAGTWTAEEEATDVNAKADKLMTVYHPGDGETIYASITGHTASGVVDDLPLSIWKGTVPREALVGAKRFYDVVHEFDTSVPWDDVTVANVTQSVTSGHTKIAIAAGHSTATAAVMNIDALDMREADSLVAEVFSTTALASGDFRFVYDDVEDLGETDVPSKVYFEADYDGTPAHDEWTEVVDGDANTFETVSITTDDYLWIGYSKPFNKISFTLGTKNEVACTLWVNYFNGATAFAVPAGLVDGTAAPAGDPFGQDGSITFTMPQDWKPMTVNSTDAYWIRIRGQSADLTASTTFKTINVTRKNNTLASIPAIPINTWATVVIGINPPVVRPDESSIKSIGLYVSVDKGATDFHIRKLYLANQAVERTPATAFRMPGGNKITGLQAYAGNVDDPILNPWIFTTSAVYEMQTQNDDQIVQIPLEELGSLSSSENGLAHCVNGTYLYFNIGEKIERYFNRTLDDIGPDRDEGLPSGRSGIPKSLASYPGRVYAAIDAGTSGTSSVLALDGSAWHEVYRAPRTGERIKSIYVQPIPGTNVDRLWISMGSDVLWVPISLNPYTETDYTYTHEGTLETSWIYANMLDVVRLWKSLKVFGENYGGGTRYVVADYKVDNDTTWTYIGTFDVSPVEEIDIAATLPQSKRIKFRLRIRTQDASNSPRLKAFVVEGVAFVPVKYQYAMSLKLSQDEDNIDLDGVHDSTLDADAQFDKMVSWANGGTPLTLRHKSDLYDNKTVFIDPISIQPMNVVNDVTGKIEEHVAQLTCIEV